MQSWRTLTGSPTLVACKCIELLPASRSLPAMPPSLTHLFGINLSVILLRKPSLVPSLRHYVGTFCYILSQLLFSSVVLIHGRQAATFPLDYFCLCRPLSTLHHKGKGRVPSSMPSSSDTQRIINAGHHLLKYGNPVIIYFCVPKSLSLWQHDNGYLKNKLTFLHLFIAM